VIPIGIYFLLTIVEDSIPLLRSWKAKAALSFGIVAVSEIVQAFGIYFFGSTFDPLDLVMFGAGVLLAAGLDRLFSAVFPFWSGEAAPAPA